MTTPSPDNVTRYGEKRATLFAQNKCALIELTDAFDLLAERKDTIMETRLTVEAYDHLRELLVRQHKEILEMEKQ